MAKKKKQRSAKRCVEPGHLASSSGKTLRTYDVGALPIINRIMERMRLSDILEECLPEDGLTSSTLIWTNSTTTRPAYRSMVPTVKPRKQVVCVADRPWPLRLATVRIIVPT